MNRLSIVIVVLLMAACQRQDGSQITAPRQPDPAAADLPQKEEAPGEMAAGAAAQLAPTQGNTVNGSLALAAAEQGVRITGAVQGLKPDGEFGFHVHEKGDCSAADGSSAGGHFNPSGQQHGNPTGESHHGGDMVNIRSNAEGVAQVDTTITGVSLHSGGADDVLGKAVVVHEAPDDYTTQPSGNSGKRIACGVIAAPSA